MFLSGCTGHDNGITQIVQGERFGFSCDISFLSDNTKLATTYKTTKSDNITVMTTVADNQVWTKFSDHSSQLEDGRDMKTIPERNKRNIDSSFYSFLRNFTFFSAGKQNRVPQPLEGQHLLQCLQLLSTNIW